MVIMPVRAASVAAVSPSPRSRSAHGLGSGRDGKAARHHLRHAHAHVRGYHRAAGHRGRLRSISASDAAERFAFLGGFVGVDNPASSEVTRKVLGWEPAYPGLIEDLDHGHYFEPSAS